MVRSALADAFEVYQVTDVAAFITWETIPETDWLAEWKRHWKPTEVGRFVIAPPWSEIQGSDKIVIRIEPLPKSAAGKILKRDLRGPYWEGHDRTV